MVQVHAINDKNVDKLAVLGIVYRQQKYSVCVLLYYLNFINGAKYQGIWCINNNLIFTFGKPCPNSRPIFYFSFPTTPIYGYLC